MGFKNVRHDFDTDGIEAQYLKMEAYVMLSVDYTTGEIMHDVKICDIASKDELDLSLDALKGKTYEDLKIGDCTGFIDKLFVKGANRFWDLVDSSPKAWDSVMKFVDDDLGGINVVKNAAVLPAHHDGDKTITFPFVAIGTAGDYIERFFDYSDYRRRVPGRYIARYGYSEEEFQSRAHQFLLSDDYKVKLKLLREAANPGRYYITKIAKARKGIA